MVGTVPCVHAIIVTNNAKPISVTWIEISTNKDSFHIPLYFENLDKEARNTETNALIVYNWNIHDTFDPERNFIKYSGISRSCLACQVDLLDHEIHHHVLIMSSI